jgi:HSP20 family molecular chaperone IbpA
MLSMILTDVQIATLEVQITPETVLIQGQWAETAEIHGYFRPAHFQSLIPLPCLVNTETAQATLAEQVLTLQLDKQDDSQFSKVRIELALPHAQELVHP